MGDDQVLSGAFREFGGLLALVLSLCGGGRRQTMVIVDIDVLITGLYVVAPVEMLCVEERTSGQRLARLGNPHYQLQSTIQNTVIERFIMTISRYQGLLILSN